VARTELSPSPYEMPLRKPDVRLSVAALTWRGSAAGSSLVDDIAPALDSFRQSDYARAAAKLDSIEGKYPQAFELPYYRALSLLLRGDANGAIPEFDKAARLADETFAADVAWYQAVAEQRAGKIADARQHLESLCRTTNAHTADACEAAGKLDTIR
jgi:tetratricopeptide (TPR) repeat protein